MKLTWGLVAVTCALLAARAEARERTSSSGSSSAGAASPRPGMRNVAPLDGREVEVAEPRDEAALAERPVPQVRVAQEEGASTDLADEEVAELRRCRQDVALESRRAMRDVLTGDVLVRFTVRPDGTVADAEAVALTPTDPAVLDCVRRRAGSLNLPGAGGARIERTLTWGTSSR